MSAGRIRNWLGFLHLQRHRKVVHLDSLDDSRRRDASLTDQCSLTWRRRRLGTSMSFWPRWRAVGACTVRGLPPRALLPSFKSPEALAYPLVRIGRRVQAQTPDGL